MIKTITAYLRSIYSTDYKFTAPDTKSVVPVVNKQVLNQPNRFTMMRVRKTKNK